MREVAVGAVSPERLAPIIGPARYDAFYAAAVRTAGRLHGRSVWNVSSTATGGGVAELLKVLLAYGHGAGVESRWLVLDGDPEFFAITKRIHNRLHGAAGDGGDLGSAERKHYLAVLEANLPQLRDAIRPDDVVILHDPQTAGLAAPLGHHGARVIWRCHVGRDTTDAYTDEAWSFLRPFCEHARGLVFSRARYVPDWVDRTRVRIIAPTIDPFSAKNDEMSADVVRGVLARVGIVAADGGTTGASFRRADGTLGSVRHPAETVQEDGPPGADVPLVVQVSRWDRLKDMAGVLRAFATEIAPRTRSHLALVGPSVAGVTDDPEGRQVLGECTALWQELPAAVRGRVSLVSLPTDDVEENAAVVNAVQRHAAVMAQKSLVEGFGLTVAEAMWKSRPVVASAVGGIQDQLTDGAQGLLVRDPTDLAAFGAAICRLLGDPDEAARLGAAARARVVERFLPDRELLQWAELIANVDESPASAR